MARSFSPSAYLHLVPRLDGWAAYHALFGNLTLLDRPGRDILDAFSGGASIEAATMRLPEAPASALRSYANDLVVRGLLVPAGADEYCLVEESEADRKRQLQTGYLVRALQLVLDKRCNYRCSYCFLDFEPGPPAVAGPPRTMTATVAGEAMREVLGLLKRNGNPVLNVEFFGGEPLMNAPVIQWVLETFGTECDGIRLLYSITTNGSLITAETAELFHRYGVTVTVSVDLPCQVDGTAHRTAKVGTRVAQQLRLLREHDNAVTFNAVISQSTIDLFDGHGLLDFAKEHGAQMVGLILDLDLAFYKRAGNLDRATRMLLDTYRYGREIGIRVGGYWALILDQISGAQPINLQTGYKTCPATGCKIAVEPDGSIFTCECTSGSLGHVSALDAVLASEIYADYALRAYRQAPECAGCEIEGFCSGVCMGSLERDYGRTDVLEAGACDIFRSVTRTLISEMPAPEIPWRLELSRYVQ